MPAIPTRKELDAKKQEINVLYGKVSEVESSLKEEKKINARLHGDLSVKMNQLTATEKSIVEEQETYRWTKDDANTKMKLISVSGDERIQELDNIENELSIEMAEHDLMEEENQRLHSRLKILATEHYNATTQQKEEREIRKQSSFEMRATMEQILRRTLKEVDREYMLKANDKMDNEANWARQENAKLKKEAIKRQENCASLVRQQQESYEELVTVKVQKDVLEEAAIKQEESSRQAQLHLENIVDVNIRLSDRVSELEADIEILVSQVEHKKSLQIELQKQQRILAKAVEERKKIQRDVVMTIRKSVDRGLNIAAQNRKREGKKLTKGFSMMSGDPDAAPVEGENNQAKKDSPIPVEDDDQTVSTVVTSMTFLNNEEVALQMEREELLKIQEEEDAEASWNSKKSDIHVATKLRQEIRKIRKRELRESLRKEASRQ
jgi:hypothetical protein